jgi:predicted nucleotidyltransferase component of viral defense system
MISAREIQSRANHLGVRDLQIEKDYVISWVLLALAKHPKLQSLLIFKGGTVLKKVYYCDYRFSEDLDFTCKHSNFSGDQLFSWFDEIFQCIRQEANMILQSIKPNLESSSGIHFMIQYQGPLGGFGRQKGIKVDISKEDILIYPSIPGSVFIEYSDLSPFQLITYALEEVFIEKMRCIIQRMQARDYYDLWFISANANLSLGFLWNDFVRKCESKRINPALFYSRLKDRVPFYRGQWRHSLGNQIRDLPAFEKVEREINRYFKK